ncbi:MAG: hypothetical protein LiPW41_587 [Parcubacteria group bacterium LiPW_41]|nr:MAG: hypothetical protein LiPW41_587 [Parcubacteria group bacterium LiPW_41]
MKQIITWIVICVSVLGFVYGSIKPYKKAAAYVTAVKSGATSVEGFTDAFKAAFEYPSPVGQDELIRFISSDIMNVVAEGKNDETVANKLTDFIHTYADPKIESKVGMNYTQLVMILGTIHTYKWKQYQKPEDFALAMQYFIQGYNINPDRPQFLIGLVDLYEASGQNDKADAVKQHIAELWER